MKQTQLDKLLYLVNRTGDKLVILDKTNDEPVVIMSVTDYESLLNNANPVKGLSEEDMMNKINRDIALWRSHQQNQGVDITESQFINQGVAEEEPVYFEHENIDEMTTPTINQLSDFDGAKAEESLADVVSEDEELEFKPEPIFEPI